MAVVDLLRREYGSTHVFNATAGQFRKSSFEAHVSLRDFLATQRIHDFAAQRVGLTYRTTVACLFFDGTTMLETVLSFNRPNRGDRRFWIPASKRTVSPDDNIALAEAGGLVIAVDTSAIDRLGSSALAELESWLRPRSPSDATALPDAQTDWTAERQDDAGLATSHADRVAMEAHSREFAISYLERELGWKFISPTRGSVPYDLLFEQAGAQIFVEVKSTRGAGRSVNVTSGEIDQARQAHPNTALLVLSNVNLVNGQASGGTPTVEYPWTPKDEALIATSYRYRVEAQE